MQQRDIRYRIVVAVVSAMLVLALGTTVPAAAAAPKLKADYRFQVSLDSSVPGARHLDRSSIFGTVYSQDTVRGRTVYILPFTAGDALDLAAASTVFPHRQYTIVILMRFDTVTSYRRIIDFSNQNDDTGLYVDSGLLDMYDYDAPPSEVPTIAPDKWVQVVLTRSLTGRLKGYVNGVRQFSYDDAVNKLGVVSDDDNVIFFQDTSAAENSAGAVARIRIYNSPLTDSQVAHLTTIAPPVSVTTSHSSAARSGAVTVSGKNFTPHEFVAVTLKDSHGQSFSLAIAKANASGSFSISEKIPPTHTSVVGASSLGVSSASSRTKSISASTDTPAAGARQAQSRGVR